MSPDYYTTAAQVIPVVLLVMLFEATQDRGPTREALELLLVGISVLCLVVGEAAALHVLSTEHPTNRADWIIEAGLTLGAVTVGYQMVAHRIMQVPWLANRQWARVAAYVGFYGAMALLISYVFE